MVRKATSLPALAASVMAAAMATFWSSPARSQSDPWELFVNQEVRYFSWRGDRGYPAAGLATTARGSGWQLYAPLTVQLTGVPFNDLKFEFVGRGGYVTASQTTPGATGSVSTATDTVVAATWTYLAIPGLQPFLALNANLPSGTSVLRGTNTFARMDPDLVDIATFGEGWNFGPTIGVNFALMQNVILSVGVGHTLRGEYNREATPTIPGFFETRIKPGDVTTVNVSLGYRFGALAGMLSGSYSHEGSTSFDGVTAFQLGDRFFVSSLTSYSWSETSITSLVASWNYFEKNKIPIPPPFAIEPFNSNSNVYRVRLEHSFIFGDWSLGPVASWLFRDNNAYVPTTYQFVPAKTRWSAGGNLRYSIAKNTLLYASAEYIWIEERARPAGAPTTLPDLSYTGLMVTGGASLRY